jgi:HK97 family phage major capsid protein
MDEADGITLDEAQTKEYDELDGEVKSIDAHLVRMRALEKTQLTAAKPAPDPLVKLSERVPVITVKSALPPGTAMTRVIMARAATKGDSWAAIEYAKQWEDSTPEVALFLKAAVAAGTTTTPAWAGYLAQYANLQNEFLELLRPATIIGKIPGLRRVPFNTRVPAQTAGGTYGWVGQAKPKPVTALTFAQVQLDIAKAAGIIVLTEELVRTSTPSAEAIVRADMIAGIAQFLDAQFIDPSVAAVADTNPASITNGLTPITSADDALVDLHAILAAFSAGNVPLAGVTLIMSETNALGMGMLRDAMGNRMFPNVGPTGGSAEGITIITSNTAGTNVIALQPSAVLYADDGGVMIDVSREASVQMDSAPASPADATTVLVSLWQNNLVGLRAERWINWKRGRDAAVQLVTGASYAPAAAALAARSGGAAPAATASKNKSDR